eukprot:TRINITY_DN12635_c0_g1_i7.p1 TRINITY_DN12635_c0_g1~~TRINITY_DN12635_c0_g1_i7.p1  ORF type:complete len:239 (-),score=14.76 TRINITY_DN12635_c0_g1_i7:224-940(-)
MAEPTSAEVDVPMQDIMVTAISVIGNVLLDSAEFSTCDTIQDVKEAIERNDGGAVWSQRLLLANTMEELANDRALSGCDSEDGHLHLTVISQDRFRPAEGWDGRQEGYVFKMGAEGLGYYLDENNPPHPRSPLDGKWIKEGIRSNLRNESQHYVLVDAGKIWLRDPTVLQPLGSNRWKFEADQGFIIATLTVEQGATDVLVLSAEDGSPLDQDFKDRFGSRWVRVVYKETEPGVIAAP